MEKMENANVLRILLASDTHLGYKEKDNLREKDSFTTYEEIFKIAKEKDVDFVLLGGDLFHDNKPSRKSLHTAMEIMRKYCLGSRPCQVEVISDQAVNFGHTSRTISSVNYEDPNLNISMPVFSIHGNHDEPTGSSNPLSAIDILSVSGLLNHFGKATNLESIEISPVLLQKGTTKLALYGLGSMRDERLNRLFSNKQVKFLRPQESTGEWFNVMVIHQNRAKHGPKNYIPEEFLDSFLDLVIWGHEHECLIDPQWNASQNFHVIQPGSPVATSLCAGESKKKHVAVISIRGREMKVEPVPLQTVRLMYVEDIVLKKVSTIPSPQDPLVEKAIQDLCRERIETLIRRAEDEHSGNPKQPKEPLIRLRIDYSGGYPTFISSRLCGKFAKNVANPDNIVLFMKKSATRDMKSGNYDMKNMEDVFAPDMIDKVKLEDMVEECLTSEKKYEMSLLTAKGMGLAVKEVVLKDEKDAIDKLIVHQLGKMSSYLNEQESLQLKEEAIIAEVVRFKEERKNVSHLNSEKVEDVDNDEEEYKTIFSNTTNETNLPNLDDIVIQDDSDSVTISDEEALKTSRSQRSRQTAGTKKGRGMSSKRGGRGAKATTRGKETAARKVATPRQTSVLDAFCRGASQSQITTDNQEVTEILDSDEEMNTKPPPNKKRSRPAPRSKGVQFSSDEDENPFGSFGSKRKR